MLFDRLPVRPFAAADPERYAERCAQLGEDAVHRAERQATLFHLDRRWSEHLGAIADLREGIYLLRVAGEDPLTRFVQRAVESFHEMEERIDDDVLRTLRTATLTGDGIDLEKEGLLGPSATWTYLVDDDPFRDQLGIQLAGDTGMAAAVAAYAGPLLILWGFLRRAKLRRRGLR